MDFSPDWDQLRDALGLNEPQVVATVARAIQVLVIALLTIWIAGWLSRRVKRSAGIWNIDARGGVLISRGVAFGVFCVGVAVIIAILGANWTAIAAVLGAATLGITLSFQDLGRSAVNGFYILIERPFRVGDRIRVSDTQGRVEEVGVRLTRLRTDAGERILVPNTLIFSSIIENVSVGTLDHQTFVLTNVKTPTAGIKELIHQSLAGLAELSTNPPTIFVLELGADGARIEVTVEHELGRRVNHVVIDRLHQLFPEATIMVKSASGDA